MAVLFSPVVLRFLSMSLVDDIHAVVLYFEILLDNVV
jgi:hypothetical protein